MFCFSLWNIFHIRTIIVGGGPINLFQGVFLFFKKRVTSCLIGFVVENDFEINRNYTRAPWTFFFFLSFFLRHKRRFEMLYIERKMADASLGSFFYLLPPQEVGGKKGWRLPSGFRVPMLLLPEKKKVRGGGKEKVKEQHLKKSVEKMSELCRFKTKPKKKLI